MYCRWCLRAYSTCVSDPCGDRLLFMERKNANRRAKRGGGVKMPQCHICNCELEIVGGKYQCPRHPRRGRS